jgi:hypothetical protein
MLIKLKEVKMNRKELKQFLNENNISFVDGQDSKLDSLKDLDITVDSSWITAMGREDNAKARKALRLLCKKYTMMCNDFSIEPKEWKYNDKAGKYTFKGQKVEQLRFEFDDNEILKEIYVTFIHIFEEQTGYKANSSWATASDREEAMFKMHMTEFCLKPKYNE